MNDATAALPVNAQPRFRLLAKLSGSVCSLDCAYCFFLSKEAPQSDRRPRMFDATLETYNFALLMMLFALADTGEKKGLPLVTIPAQ